MLVSLKVLPLVLASIVVAEDGLNVEAKHVLPQGQSITCGAPSGCIIMSQDEFSQLAEDVYKAGAKVGHQICKREI